MTEIHGLHLTVSAASFDYPELVAKQRELAAAQLRRNAGVPETAEVVWMPDVPFRQEGTGEFYEYEGEQVEEFITINCSMDEATSVSLVCEVTV